MPETISVVGVSDALTFFRIQGRDADHELSIASPLNVHGSVFSGYGASYTEAFGVKALIIRCAGGFELVVDRSYSDMIKDYLQRALDS